MCSAAGRVSDGAICTNLLDASKTVLTFKEFIEFLEAEDATGTTGARGAAMSMAASDWGTMKTELEVACRLLKSRCTYNLKAIIKSIDTHNITLKGMLP